ncbi:MAG: hypothetical protein HY678_06020 [Chloroflexi bacterium]|nr:hypothetical protein [Chloroflexota bacterium]
MDEQPDTTKHRQSSKANRLTRVTPGARGSARISAEALPSDQEGEELVVVRKFCGALVRRAGRTVEVIERAGDWPDFLASEGGRELGLELGRVRHPDAAERRALEQQYAESIAQALSTRHADFRGLSILLTNIEDDRYPVPNATQGRSFAGLIAQRLIKNLDRYKALMAPESDDADLLMRNPDGLTIHATCYRLSNKGGQGFVGFNPRIGASAEPVLQALNTKLKKHYTVTSGRGNWLALYDLDHDAGHNPALPELRRATEVLRLAGHPFAEVWYFFPTLRKMMACWSSCGQSQRSSGKSRPRRSRLVRLWLHTWCRFVLMCLEASDRGTPNVGPNQAALA